MHGSHRLIYVNDDPEGNLVVPASGAVPAVGTQVILHQPGTGKRILGVWTVVGVLHVANASSSGVSSCVVFVDPADGFDSYWADAVHEHLSRHGQPDWGAGS